MDIIRRKEEDSRHVVVKLQSQYSTPPTLSAAESPLLLSSQAFPWCLATLSASASLPLYLFALDSTLILHNSLLKPAFVISTHLSGVLWSVSCVLMMAFSPCIQRILRDSLSTPHAYPGASSSIHRAT